MRCGILVNVTPFALEREGFVTLEISNTALCLLRCMPKNGCAGLCSFGRTLRNELCGSQGKYHKRQGIVLPGLQGHDI